LTASVLPCVRVTAVRVMSAITACSSGAPTLVIPNLTLVN
jgi:hypothetical protein